jgi:hypothetical protein
MNSTMKITVEDYLKVCKAAKSNDDAILYMLERQSRRRNLTGPEILKAAKAANK